MRQYSAASRPEADRPGGGRAEVGRPEADRPEFVNRYEDTCPVCLRTVPAGQGLRQRDRSSGHDGHWSTYHRSCLPEEAPPPRRRHKGWHSRTLMAFDIAATGNRPTVDRVVAAAVRSTDGSTGLDLLIDPGPEVQLDPVGERHGITAEMARTGGAPAAEALDRLADTLAAHLATKNPLVVWHAPWVLSLLESELLRHGLPSLAARCPEGLAPIADPLVLDRHADQFRSGGRARDAVADWYGIPYDRPGHPASDAETVLVLAQVIAACYPHIGKLSRPALHTEQVRWSAEWAERLRKRDPRATPDPRWPVATVAADPWTPPPPPPPASGGRNRS
ncbi:hypothetical protein [Streptomyces sp. 7N604]|uniref:hypothetical protein n=1 Tax=Streptomyces sp. 7N604 TaxID=3457415 RepID=UPI003FD3262B